MLFQPCAPRFEDLPKRFEGFEVEREVGEGCFGFVAYYPDGTPDTNFAFSVSQPMSIGWALNVARPAVVMVETHLPDGKVVSH